jgi:hypothetical protein
MRPTRNAPSGPSHGMSLTINAARSADDAQNIGIILAVRAQHDGLDLHFVIPALGKQRADRAVGQAAGENFLFRRTAFAFEVAAGELARGGGFFAVIHGQREKLLAGFGLGRGDGGHETMVSPSWTVTAPSACLASFPVSMMICLSPSWAVIFSGIIFAFPLPPRNFSESRTFRD